MLRTVVLALLPVVFIAIGAVDEVYHPHLSKVVKIVGYNGPIDQDMVTLFREAETIEMINSTFTTAPKNLYVKVPKLKKIVLQDVTCPNVHEDVMQGAKALEEFIYIRMNVNALPIRSFRNLPNFKELIVKELVNPHKVIVSNALHGCFSLKVFELSSSGLERIEDQAFKDLDHLEILNLNHNKLESISKEWLKPLKALKNLELKGNLIKKFSTDDLPELPNLEQIDISKNPLNEINFDNVAKVAPKLKVVVIKDTPILPAKLKEISEKTKIAIITELKP